MRRQGKCVHFNGTMNECCAAGVNYRELAGPGDGYGLRLPCHGPDYRTGTGRPLPQAAVTATCDKRREPTAEELGADEAESSKRMAATIVARGSIVAACGGPWKKGTPGASGVIDCPACGRAKGLHYSRAGYNGHVHARCETKGCVSWIE